MHSNSSLSSTPTRRLSPTISPYDTSTNSTTFRRDLESLSLSTDDDRSTEHRRSLSSSQGISYRVPSTASNGERDSLLPSVYSTSSPTAASSSSRAAAATRADRSRGVAIVLVTVLVLLVHTLYQHLSQSSVDVRTYTTTATTTAPSHQHNSHSHEHASDTQPDTVDASALFDEGNDIDVLYHPVVIDALPYTTAPLDSTGSSIHLHGRYSDSSNFLYPLCTFSRVCTTASHLHIAVQSNYTVWAYYATVLPYCHDVLHRRLEVCGCFHYNFRITLLEWRGLLTDVERADGERLARAMVENQFGGLADWTRGWEQVGPARERPTIAELQQMQWVQPPQLSNDDRGAASASWQERARSSLSAWLSPSSSPRTPSIPGVYPDPFAAPPLSIPPSNWTSPSTNLSLHYYDSHYWSIHKWVDHHHIAHWAQKLLVLYATVANYHHACHHSYRKLHLPNLHYLTPLIFHPRLEATPTAVSEFVDVRARVGEVRDVVEGEQWDEAGEWGLECMDELAGVVFHDSWEPFTEHEQHILAVTVEAMHDWMGTMDDDEIRHIHTPQPTTTNNASQPRRLHPLHRNADSAAITPAAAFSTANNIYTGGLFRQYPQSYVDGGHYPRHIPPPANHSTLSCFRRLSFSPMYGFFTRSAYDLHVWRDRALRHYGIDRHASHYARAIGVPLLVANHTSAYLPIPLTPLPPSSRVDHSLTSALSLMTCPPPRAVFVTRPDRSVVNVAAIVDRVRDRYNVAIDVVSIDATTPSSEQARLFAGAGLLLSAHSSQMVNVLFSGGNSVMVEVTAEYYNIDFFNYARSVGVRFFYALGGRVVDKADEGDAMRSCVTALREQCGGVMMGGDSFCVERVAWERCTERRTFPNKGKAFEADVDAVERAVREGLKHLLHACAGRWGNAQLAKWS